MKKQIPYFDTNKSSRQELIAHLEAKADYYQRKSHKLKFMLEEIFCGIAFGIILMLIIVAMIMMG